MKRLAWLTDIHLNFVERPNIELFCQTLADAAADALLVSGDIGEAPDVALHLNFMAARCRRPIYFVLGNHDFYRGSLASVRAQIADLCAKTPNLHWLSSTQPIALTETTALVGHDGWADGRFGDYWNSTVAMNDWWFIAEFLGLDDAARLELLHKLGDEAAAHFRSLLPGILQQFQRVIVVTHVPPFREACWHQGKLSDDDWLPHFACKSVGEVLTEAMAAHPDRQMTVLCGHTHGAGEALILPNLRVLTGGAVYGSPQIQQMLTVP